jgi:hypothetical protein
MNEFETEVSGRVEQARRSLAEAEATGDVYLVGVRVGELESLSRLATDHGVEVPGLAEEVERHTGEIVIQLPNDLAHSEADRA